MTLWDFQDAALDRSIHPSELMHHDDVSRYLWVGASALDCIEAALVAARKRPEDLARILDLPCGHGRVMRYLRAAFPGAEITGCDLLRDGVDHCAARYNAVPVYSCDDPERIPLKAGYDLIWVGSLFTHLPRDLWVRFLKTFESVLGPNGLLVFTTHGRQSLKWLQETDEAYHLGRNTLPLLAQFDRHNFGYVRYPGSEHYYGMSLSTTGWVCDLIEAETELRLALFGERAWACHQDVYACVRDPGWRPREFVKPRRPSLSWKMRHFVRRMLRLS